MYKKTFVRVLIYNLYKFICSFNTFYNGKLLEVSKFYTTNMFGNKIKNFFF